MFNVTILKMKDIIKYFLIITILISIVIYVNKVFLSMKEKENLDVISFGSLVGCLDETIPTMKTINNDMDNVETDVNNNYLEKFLKTEMTSMKAMEEIQNEKNIEISNKSKNEETLENEQVESYDNNLSKDNNAKISLENNENIKTEVVTSNPILESYNSKYGNVKIKNQTTYNLTEEILNPNIEINNKNILIFHTHSCESYTSSESYPYIPTGNYRTTDLNYTVTGVGTQLEKYLKEYNFNVIHDTSYHDYPSYTGSYTRSLQTVENILKNNSCDIIIDLHRDAIGSRPDYAPTVKIGEDYAAQIMFVIGTNEGGLWHPNWNQNLKFAVKVQEKAEEMYPRAI